jgi:hypothetical protein
MLASFSILSHDCAFFAHSTADHTTFCFAS